MRIGLSATQKPIEAVSRNLVGTNVSDGLALILTGGAAGPVLGLLGMVPGVDAVGSERGANELLERDDSGNPKN